MTSEPAYSPPPQRWPNYGLDPSDTVALLAQNQDEGPWNRDSLLRLLDHAQRVRTYHHSALWEIQKHFTWWVSIVMGAVMLVLTSANIDDPKKKGIGITLSIFGLLISLIGMRAVYLEGTYFSEAMQVGNRLFAALGLHRPFFVWKNRKWALHPGYPIEDFQAVRKKANQFLKLSVRNLFLFVLVISAVAFIVMIFVFGRAMLRA